MRISDIVLVFALVQFKEFPLCFCRFIVFPYSHFVLLLLLKVEPEFRRSFFVVNGLRRCVQRCNVCEPGCGLE